MTLRQQAMYWAEWSKLRDVLRAKGKTAGEIEAHRYNVTLRAIGSAKSSKLFSNGELDRVIARIKAETSPGDFGAQMRQQEQPDRRRAAALERCDRAALAMADGSCGEYQFATLETRQRYIASMAKRLCGKWPDQCDEADLSKVAGVLEARVKQLARAMSEHVAKVGAAAGISAPEAAPADLQPGEDF